MEKEKERLILQEPALNNTPEPELKLPNLDLTPLTDGTLETKEATDKKEEGPESPKSPKSATGQDAIESNTAQQRPKPHRRSDHGLPEAIPEENSTSTVHDSVFQNEEEKKPTPSDETEEEHDSIEPKKSQPESNTRQAEIQAKAATNDKEEYIPENIRHLSHEVKLLMRLNHPNVIKLYQLIETPSEFFVVM